MASLIRSLVSKKKYRYQEDGFDLDLTYIDGNIIAMGFPANSIQGFYRNPIEDVSRFMEERHKDHYRVYNLCSERTYDKGKFSGSVVHYAFDDHCPPSIFTLEKCVKDMYNWISRDKSNVAVVHCKAGKGRTGVMISAYYLYRRHNDGTYGEKSEFKDAIAAMDFYGHQRTKNGKGVTIPSQRRYVEYYDILLERSLSYSALPHLQVCSVRFSSFPVNLGRTFHPCFTFWCLSSDDRGKPYSRSFDENQSTEYLFDSKDFEFFGDCKIEVSNKKSPIAKPSKLFHLHFNTFFFDHLPTTSRSKVSCLGTVNRLISEFTNVRFEKHQLDRANKDKECKVFSSEFYIEVTFKQCQARVSMSAPSSSNCLHSEENSADGDLYMRPELRNSRENLSESDDEVSVGGDLVAEI